MPKLRGDGEISSSFYLLLLSYIFIVVFLTESTSPYSLNTQRGWQTSELCHSCSKDLQLLFVSEV